MKLLNFDISNAGDEYRIFVSNQFTIPMTLSENTPWFFVLKKLIFLLLTIHISLASDAQNLLPENSFLSTYSIKNNDSILQRPDKKRVYIAGGNTAIFYSGMLVALNQAWYKDFPRTSFHTFNDSREWLQVDKIGHAWTVYNLAKYSTAMWKWTGLQENKTLWIGGLSAMGYLTIIEFLDAHSIKWGWSWADMGANLAGTGIFIAQEGAWHEQRIQFKFSSHIASYDPSIKKRANDLYGKSFVERIFKDYNSQTYWLSINLKSFVGESKLPQWLNLAVGYGADGLLGGFENKWTDGDPGFPINRSDIKRKRQFYLSPDIDLSKIKTNKKGLRILLDILNVLKIPAPALMLDSEGKLRAYGIYF